MKSKILPFAVSFLLVFATLAQSADVEPLGLRLEDFEYPFDVNFFPVAVQQETYEMAYMDVQPEAANGEVIMLLHGKNFNGAYWEETANALKNEGYRVIIPDQVGFGKSAKPEYLQYTFHLLAENTKQLLDTLGVNQLHVLGHSMGGMLATRLALMYPEMVSKLILLNPIGLEDWKAKGVPYRPVDWWYKNELEKDYESIKKYQKESYYDGQWEPEYDPWVEILAGWTKNEDYERIAWNAALTYDMIYTQPVYYEFDDLKMPVVLILGQRDRTALGKNLVSAEIRKMLGNYPKMGKDVASRIKNSTLVELEGLGHLPHIEAFETFFPKLLDSLQ